MKTSEKQQHTPGPWTMDRYGSIKVGPHGQNTLLVDGVALPSGNHHDIEEAKANTRLLFAAPDLLRLAYHVLTARAKDADHAWHVVLPTLREIANAAIEKVHPTHGVEK